VCDSKNTVRKLKFVSSSLTDCVIVITGAGSGIGAATALELQRRGAAPVLVDCDRAGLAATAAALGGDAVLSVVADVTSRTECDAVIAAALARHGRIDIVWANAGIASFAPLAQTDPAAWQRVIDVNVVGVFNTVRAGLPAVLQRRGYVAVTASAASFAHPPGMSAYAASKAAVEAMCNAWRIELASHGVGVGVIHASWVHTPLVTEGALHPGFARLRAAMPGPLGRITPVDLAARRIADGLQRRARRIWVPGWVRALFWLRALLHTPAAERSLLLAAPEIERESVALLATNGGSGSPLGAREQARVQAAAQRAATG
jgi:NAD(P)-dependent dehydrogenase (short-subunit alcohol dehydrogenase family)